MNTNGHIQIDAQRSRAGSLLGLLLLSCLWACRSARALRGGQSAPLHI